MSREMLKRYKKNKKEIQELKNLIEEQKRKKEKLRVVSGKVMKSSDEFPYIQQNITVEMVEPENGSRIDDRIREYEGEKAELQKEEILKKADRWGIDRIDLEKERKKQRIMEIKVQDVVFWKRK